jgi:hypothetical protein
MELGDHEIHIFKHKNIFIGRSLATYIKESLPSHASNAQRGIHMFRDKSDTFFPVTHQKQNQIKSFHAMLML